MKVQVLLVVVICLVATPANVLADTWCNSAYPPGTPSCQSGAIFCDDFDRYCQGAPPCPPPPPMPCATGSPKSVGAIRAVWVPSSTNPNGLCGTQFTVEEDTRFLTSGPFGGRYPCQGDAQLGQQTVDLVPYIQYKYGSQVTTAEGTDDEPLVLRFDMSGGVQTATHVQYDTGYLELALEDARAPMDYVKVGVEEVPGCDSCFYLCGPQNYGPHIAWPHVCQSYEPRTVGPARCPPLQTNVRAALAVGVNALLDNDPCHCDEWWDQVPRNPYLSFYDGLKWRIVHPDHAGPPGETPPVYQKTGNNYFVLGKKTNTVVLTIKTSTVDIYHRTKDWDTGEWVESWVTGITRQYDGPFNKLRGGAGTGCELMNSRYACVGNTRCTRVGDTRCDGGGFQNTKAGFIAFDGVALYGGLGYLQDGACCLPDATCVEVSELGCQTMGGRFNGPGTSCANTLCCPVPFADSDVDADVDQDDFGAFQACFTGPGPATVVGDCTCFDRDAGGTGDGDVDTDDLSAFEACASGPGVQADPACEGAAAP